MGQFRDLESLGAPEANSAEPPISEAELTALALKDPPPDEFKGPEANQKNPIAAPSGTRVVWLIGALAAGLLGALFVYSSRTQSHEVARQRSPDGNGDAILMEFSGDAAETHSYKVCMQRPSGIKFVPNNCREVAYLGGVGAKGGIQPVTLIWATSSQLEIRYVNASAVHVYQPVFTWGSARARYVTRVANIRPITIKAVQTGYADESLPGQSR